MPAKTTISKTTKSNVARSSSLKKGNKFNWKIAVVIGLILVAGVGYLFVRLSRAGGFVWAPKDMTLYPGMRWGELVTKSDGRPAVQSQAGAAPSPQRLIVKINSSVSTVDTYCVNGNATGDTTISGLVLIIDANGPGTTMNRLGEQKVGAGAFRTCFNVQGNTTSRPREIEFSAVAANDKPLAFFSIERVGAGSGAGTKTNSNAPSAAPVSPPAGK